MVSDSQMIKITRFTYIKVIHIQTIIIYLSDCRGFNTKVDLQKNMSISVNNI